MTRGNVSELGAGPQPCPTVLSTVLWVEGGDSSSTPSPECDRGQSMAVSQPERVAVRSESLRNLKNENKKLHPN